MDIQPYTLRNTGFSAEFANFVNFVGGAQLDEAIHRVATKLKPLSAPLRALYEDRYFFHIHCASVADPPRAFQLNPGDARAVRVASLIAGVNRMRASLSKSAALRFRSAIIGSLRPDRDFRQFEHEVRTFVHLGQKRVAVTLVDLERLGQFDMLCKGEDGGTFEVECKTVTEDTGEQVKTDLLVALSETFRKTLNGASKLPGSGVYTVTFIRPPDQCRNLPSALLNALKFPTPRVFTEDFRLEFRRKQWGVSSSSDMVQRDLQAISRKYFAAKFGDMVLALALRPTKPSTLGQKMISTLKEAADQCSGRHPSLLWLHLIGHSEEEFLEVAKFSQNGEGAGLNAIVANVLHPKVSSTDRSHVYKIRFSAEPSDTIERLVIDQDRMIRKAKSLSGMCYEVPNSFCRFNIDLDA